MNEQILILNAQTNEIVYVAWMVKPPNVCCISVPPIVLWVGVVLCVQSVLSTQMDVIEFCV